MKTSIVKPLLLVFALQVVSMFVMASPSAATETGQDTLFVLQPMVSVVANDNRSATTDVLLTDHSRGVIDSIARNLLKKKFAIDTSRLFVNNAEAMRMFESLDETVTLADTIKCCAFLPDQLKQRAGYALLMQYSGQYHPDFPPHFKLQSGVMGVAVVTPGNPTKAVSEMRLLVVELKTGKAVLLDRAKSSKYDARRDDDLIQMTRTFLKEVYYRKW